MKLPVGIDEVGRGPVAGPLCVCALRLSSRSSFYSTNNIRDSKQLSRAEREVFFETLVKEKNQGKVTYVITYVSAAKIDNLGMSRALKLAVSRVIKRMNVRFSDPILLDGSLKAPSMYIHQKTLIKGDEKEKVIALASIVAKVSRDKRMLSFSRKWPHYGFERHKGYGTHAHFDAIQKYGPISIHRRTFLKKVKRS